MPTVVNVNSYFPTLNAFELACCQDKGLTPSAQLVFRVLLEHANRSRWADAFAMSTEEIERITHLAHQTVMDARRCLKNHGYIDFKGKPSKYTIYSLVDNEVDNSQPPTPPVLIRKYNERNKQERKGEPPHDANSNHSGDNRSNLSDAAKAKVERCLAKFNQQFNNY